MINVLARPAIRRSLALPLFLCAFLLAAVPVLAAVGVIQEFALTSPTSGPVVVTKGPDGNMWATEFNAGKIARITPSGQITEFPVGGGTQPSGINQGPDRNLWFTEFGANTIGVMNTSGYVVATYVVPTANSHPTGIKSGDDALWFIENSSGKIARITTGGKVTEYPVPEANSNIFSLIVAKNGDVWYTDYYANLVGQLNPKTGHFKTFAIPTPNSGPSRIVVGTNGDLYVTENFANKVARMTPSGKFTEYTIPTASSGALGIWQGPDGNFWIAEYNANQIARMTPTGTFLTAYQVPTVSSGVDNIQSGPGSDCTVMYFTENLVGKIGTITTH